MFLKIIAAGWLDLNGKCCTFKVDTPSVYSNRLRVHCIDPIVTDSNNGEFIQDLKRPLTQLEVEDYDCKYRCAQLTLV